jgi:hypothetical protein
MTEAAEKIPAVIALDTDYLKELRRREPAGVSGTGESGTGGA